MRVRAEPSLPLAPRRPAARSLSAPPTTHGRRPQVPRGRSEARVTRREARPEPALRLHLSALPRPRLSSCSVPAGQTPGQWVFPVNCARSGLIRSRCPDLGDERPGRRRAGQPSRSRPAGALEAAARFTVDRDGPTGHERAAGQREHVAVDQSRRVAAASRRRLLLVRCRRPPRPPRSRWCGAWATAIRSLALGRARRTTRRTPTRRTDCSYTWTQSSAGQPDGAYQVTATVYWQVAWTATGAPGGGNLGQVPGPAAHVAVRVAESQAVNTASGA